MEMDELGRGQGSGRSLTWWEGNQTRLWRLLLIGYMAILGCYGKWVFVKLTEIPAVYPTKLEVSVSLEKVEKSVRHLSNKIDRNFKFYVQEMNRNKSNK